MNRKAILHGCWYFAPFMLLYAVPFVLSSETTYWSRSLIYWILFGLSAFFVLVFGKARRDDYAE
jgi:hypothetical protein